MTKPCRIILLLDLDCFYAQCERVRLGLDPETCSLALLQVRVMFVGGMFWRYLVDMGVSLF
jgi:hypothetical protein